MGLEKTFDEQCAFWACMKHFWDMMLRNLCFGILFDPGDQDAGYHDFFMRFSSQEKYIN